VTDEYEEMMQLREVAAKLDGAGMSWVIFAGTAASVYGADRPVTDLDILVPAAEGERLKALFPGAVVTREQDLLHVGLAGVDLLAGLGAIDLDGEMASRVTRHKVGGIQVPVIPREDNILLKAMMGRGAEEGKHDWEDVEAMMASAQSLDWTYLRWRASTLNEPAKVQVVLERVESLWRQVRGKIEEGTSEQD
jgi:predicted nucleotidyltransferase